MDILFWTIIGTVGAGAFVASGYMWKAFRDQRERWDNEHQAELSRLQAQAKGKEAEIFAHPSGGKRDIIGKL